MRTLKDEKGNICWDLELTDEEIKSMKEYWTEERKAAAIPVDMIELEASKNLLEDATDPESVPDLNQMPYKASGKLFFKNGESDCVASAELVGYKTGDSKICYNMILTAAHCVQDAETGSLCSNFVFDRGYKKDGSYTEEMYGKQVAIKAAWECSQNLNIDYAIIITTTNTSSSEVLAYNIVTKDAVKNKDVVSYGYPKNYGDTKTMQYVVGNIVALNSNLNYIVTGMWVMNGNKMGQGCSGGAWVLRDTNEVISLNSACDKNYTLVIGPNFDEDFDSLFEFAKTL